MKKKKLTALPVIPGRAAGASPGPINADAAEKRHRCDLFSNASGYGFRVPLRGPGMTGGAIARGNDEKRR